MLRRLLRPPDEAGPETVVGKYGWRGLARVGTVLAVGLVAAIVIAAGSAGTSTKPYTASFDPGPLAG